MIANFYLFRVTRSRFSDFLDVRNLSRRLFFQKIWNNIKIANSSILL